MHWLESFCFIVIWPLTKVLTPKSYPIATICLLLVVIYAMVEFIVTVIAVLSAYTGLSHLMLGLTLMVWGSDNMEMLNLAIAISRNEEEMATIAVLSCQILCLTLVIPCACLVRMIARG